MDKIIKTTLDKGRATGGDSFKVYVTGYPDFFHVDSEQCSTVSWSVAWRIWGEHRKMNKPLRNTFNDMSNHLNGLLRDAVSRQANLGAQFVDWNADGTMMANHRYCEEGVVEPAKDRADTWFFEWPDTAPQVVDHLNDALANKLDPAVSSLSAYAAKYPDFTNKAIDTPKFLDSALAVAAENGTVDAQNWFTNTVRVFHPKAEFHQRIADKVVDSVVSDFGGNDPSTTPPTTTPPAQTSPPPEVSDICGDWYKFFFDHFEVYGKNFDAAKFGTDGAGLKKQIQGCGDLTKWHFEPKQNDPNGYQWKATGNLPIGTKACVGRAVVSAGGKSADGCSGPG